MINEADNDDSKVFEKSGEPSDIYEYECFDDQSNLEWVKGHEYRENPGWSQERKALWKFFYRPYSYGDNIAPEQKKITRELSAEIEIHEQERESYEVLKKFSIFIFLTICMILIITPNLWVLFAIPLLSYAFFHVKAWQVQQTIQPIMIELKAYESEVEMLINQQQSILKEAHSIDVEKILWDDLRSLEQTVYYDYFYTYLDQVKSKVPKFYEKVNRRIKELGNLREISDPPVFPAIPTWGLLQPVKAANNDSRATGIRAAWEDMGEKIASFRRLKDGRPFYRLWYIQYIFITKKNFSVVSFCYDIISEKKYNLAGETHQLNHITNSSSGSEDIVHMIDSKFVKLLNLPQKLVDNLYVSQVKNLKYTMSSGASYSCFIPSEKVIEGLSEWQKYKNAKKHSCNEKFTETNEFDELSSVIFNQNNVLEIIADKVADTLRKRIDGSRPLTAKDHRKNKTISD